MKKLIVLCQNYPSPENPFSQPFVHTRLLEYAKHFELVVISFASKKPYEFEGVKVLTESAFNEDFRDFIFDLMISHAPNIKNHYRFIFLNLFKFKKLMLVLHGYEVIDIHKRIYNQKTFYKFPYSHSKLVRFYHKIKLPLTSLLLKSLSRLKSCNFVFVSEILYNEVLEDLRCNIFSKGENTFIVNNPINQIFNTNSYTPLPLFDFICIRPFDDPKYGVDIYIYLAQNNPQFTFHLYGKGVLPYLMQIPKNLKIIDSFLTPFEILPILNKFKACILPTRWDSQGVLACEIAAYGMPLLTSSLEVCKEMLSKYSNVEFVPNEQFADIDLRQISFKNIKLNRKFYTHGETSHLEIAIAQKLTNEIS